MSNIRDGLGKDTKKERRRAMFRQHTKIAPEGRVPVSQKFKPTRENEVPVIGQFKPTRENEVPVRASEKAQRVKGRDLDIDDL